MRGIFKVLFIFVISLTLLASVPARAVDLAQSFVVGGDVGFDIDPDLFASALIAEYHVTSNVAFGPYFTTGFDNDNFLFATSGIAKYKANLSETGKLKPYGMVGVGFLVRNEKHSGDWDRDTEFYFPVGGGFEYWFMDNLAWGANMLFNVSDDIYWSMFVGLRTKF